VELLDNFFEGVVPAVSIVKRATRNIRMMRRFGHATSLCTNRRHGRNLGVSAGVGKDVLRMEEMNFLMDAVVWWLSEQKR